MQSNDARILRSAAIPTFAVGVIAVVLSTVLAGGKGAIGSGIGVAVAGLFFGLAVVGLNKAAEKFPEMFMAAGLLMYMTQLLAMAVLIAVFQRVSFLSPRAFAFTVIAATVVWLVGQTRGHLKAKTFYVQPVVERKP
jgi:ATP synthase protein I